MVVDDFNACTEEAGELIHANEQENWSFKKIHGSLPDLVNQKIIGREHSSEITFFKSVGSAYFDLAVAIGAYNKASQTNQGQWIDL
ncbi:MAG: hypothetical protein N4Q30_01020 [Neisseriaceae bacterium]|nr:hypothetical protein [Neisseriaceae bacterium]